MVVLRSLLGDALRETRLRQHRIALLVHDDQGDAPQQATLVRMPPPDQAQAGNGPR